MVCGVPGGNITCVLSTELDIDKIMVTCVTCYSQLLPGQGYLEDGPRWQINSNSLSSWPGLAWPAHCETHSERSAQLLSEAKLRASSEL